MSLSTQGIPKCREGDLQVFRERVNAARGKDALEARMTALIRETRGGIVFALKPAQRKAASLPEMAELLDMIEACYRQTTSLFTCTFVLGEIVEKIDGEDLKTLLARDLAEVVKKGRSDWKGFKNKFCTDGLYRAEFMRELRVAAGEIRKRTAEAEPFRAYLNLCKGFVPPEYPGASSDHLRLMRKISSSLERIGLLSGEGILEAVQDIARISFSIRGEGESVGGNLREAAIKILDASKTYLGRNYRVGILDPVKGSGFNPNLHESRGLASNGETGEISQNATILVHSVEMIGFCRGTEILEKARVKVTFKK